MDSIKKRVRRRLPLVAMFLILVVGLAVLLYPYASNLISQYTAQTEIYTYDTAVNKLDTTEIDDLYKQAEDYNKALLEGSSETLSSLNYEKLLSVSDQKILSESDAIGYVDIPQLNIYLPIYHGTSEDSLKNGVGHMYGTSLPVGGTDTHSVLAAHTGIPTADLFTFIDRLVIGDVFYIHVLGRVLAYQVDQIKVVLPNEDGDIQIIRGEDYVTLLTCTPYGINDHRLLVRGTRIPYTESDNEQNAALQSVPTTPREEEKSRIETIQSIPYTESNNEQSAALQNVPTIPEEEQKPPLETIQGIPYTELSEEQSAVLRNTPTAPEEEEKFPIETILWFWGSVGVIFVFTIIVLILFLPVGRKRNNKQSKS